MRILVVEDDTATRDALQRILEGEGLVVQSVADGEKAVGALETGEFQDTGNTLGCRAYHAQAAASDP